MYAQFLQRILMPLYEAVKGKNLLRNINDYQKHLLWTPEQLKAHQWHELKKLLNHAFENTSFYPELWLSLIHI